MKTLNLNKSSFGFSSIVQSILPWRFRRLLVLSGTYGALSSLETPLRQHAQELSEVLCLSKDPDSVEVPIALHSILVSKFNKLNVQVQGQHISLRDVVTRNLNSPERKAMAEAMAKSVHPSLQYSHRGCMVEDLYRLLGFVGNKCAQTP